MTMDVMPDTSVLILLFKALGLTTIKQVKLIILYIIIFGIFSLSADESQSYVWEIRVS